MEGGEERSLSTWHERVLTRGLPQASSKNGFAVAETEATALETTLGSGKASGLNRRRGLD